MGHSAGLYRPAATAYYRATPRGAMVMHTSGRYSDHVRRACLTVKGHGRPSDNVARTLCATCLTGRTSLQYDRPDVIAAWPPTATIAPQAGSADGGYIMAILLS